MSKPKNYTSKDIRVLSDRDHVRLRTQVYLGNMSSTSYEIPVFVGDTFEIKDVQFIPAVYKAVGEIIDNSIDEFAQTSTTNKLLDIQATPSLGMYRISDNGRGIPIDKHETGMYTPQVALGSLRSGRNFEEEVASGVIGQNGVGSACTNFCSTEFDIDINRDGKRYRQRFVDGGSDVTKPSIRKSTGTQSGTTVSFQLDTQVFDDTSLPDLLMENRAIEIALTNPGVTTQYNKTKHKFTKGFEQKVKQISKDYFRFEHDDVEFFVIFDINQSLDEKIFSWVNSSLLFDGGICNTQFLNAFYDKTIAQLTKEANKQKCIVTKNDVRQNLLVLGNLRLSNPQYDAQSKTRLTGPQRRKQMGDLLDSGWSSFVRKNKNWLSAVLDRAVVRHHANANKKAVKQHQSNLSKKVAGLVDATNKDRSTCQLLITEGDSAASMITQARDPKTTATLPLTGKVNNVYGSTIAQLLNMGKITDLLTAIGLVPGKRVLRSDLRYGKIVIATDADVDGGDIFTLLINLLFQFWPELFDNDYEPVVYRLVAPNVCVTKGDKRLHFTTHSQFIKHKSKYKNWNIDYYKGLGSMAPQDWEMILSGQTDTLIPILNDGQFEQTMTLLFGPDADARKLWLQDE